VNYLYPALIPLLIEERERELAEQARLADLRNATEASAAVHGGVRRSLARVVASVSRASAEAAIRLDGAVADDLPHPVSH
jgi:hypothetical protein